jgi:hypothetical protein
MITTTSIRPGTWCIRRLAVRNPRSAPRSAAMAASASQSTIVKLARITAASPAGIKAGTDGGLSLPEIGTGPESVQAELNRASSEQATTASGQDQRITKNDSDKGAAIIPIDAQPLGTKRLRKSRRAVRQRGLPTLLHWPDLQRAAGAAAPLRRVTSRRARNKESHARTVPESGLPIRSVRSSRDVVAGSRPSTIRATFFVQRRRPE